MNTKMAACLCVVGMCGAQPARALTPDQVYDKRAHSILVVHSWDAAGRKRPLGSGVVVAPEQVITNCHVVRKAQAVAVGRGNVSYGAQLQAEDAERDLCLLKVSELPWPAVPLGKAAAVRPGQRAFALAAPSGTDVTISDTLVSSVRPVEGSPVPLIQISAPITEIASGGALFNAEGDLVGIPTSRYQGQQDFALPVDWIREVAERARLASARRADAAGAGALPPIDRSLPREMPQVGDTWTYALIDVTYRPRDRSRTFSHTVRRASPGSIVEVMTRQGVQLAQSEFSRDLTVVYRAAPEILEVAPYATAFHTLQIGAPLRPSRFEGLEALAARSSDEQPYAFDRGEVAGMERVDVPAGSFETLRVVITGRASNLMLGGSQTARGYAPIRQTIWYAPQVKRAVKTLIEYPNQSVAYELESYALRQ